MSIQLYLIGNNLTTNEYIKKIYSDQDNPNPFNEGYFHNFKLFFLKKTDVKQINHDYLIKRNLQENKNNNSSELEFSNNCNICPKFSNNNTEAKENESNNKIKENLLIE